MKLAITMIPDTGRISPVFETAEHLFLIRFCRSGKYSVIAENKMPESESEKIDFIRSNGIRTLICGAVCNDTLEKLCDIGVRVIPFASGEWTSVANAALDKSECLPPDFIMPGCCKHHKKCCRNQGGKINENCTDKSGRNA